MRIIFAIAAAVALYGCASEYRLGDLTSGVLAMQAEYCVESDPRERALRLAALRAAGVPIPPSGACADIVAMVPEVEIDTAETEADRERFAD